jgi:hypothetical protein
MRPGLMGRLSRALVGCHPRRWRERYREEMLDVFDQHQPTARTVLNLWVSAVSAQLDPAYRTDRLSLTRLRHAALVSAAIAAPLIVIAAPVGYRVWQDDHWRPGARRAPRRGGVFPARGYLGHRFRGSHRRRLSQFEGGQPMALSPDGRTVATVAFSGQTTLWDVVDPRRPAEIATLPAGDGSKLWGQDRRSPRTAGSWPPPATTGSSCGMWPARPGPGRCATGPGVRDQRGSWR